MRAFAVFAKSKAFWVLLCGWLFFVIAYIVAGFLLTNNQTFWFLYWKNLPPLPHGETAKHFDEVRFRDSIDVLTDQGHAYRCRFLVPDNCWIPIPKEDALIPPAPFCEKIAHPSVPLDARASYLYCHEHDSWDEIFLVVIRVDGQVALWDKDVPLEFYNKFISGLTLYSLVTALDVNWDLIIDPWLNILFKVLPSNNAIVGAFFFFPGMGIGLIIDLFINRRWRRKPEVEKDHIHDPSSLA